MPVREALRHLVAERALDLGPNRTARVPIVASAKYAEVCEVRIALEGLAAEKAARLIPDSEVDRISGLCARAKAAPRGKPWCIIFPMPWCGWCSICRKATQ